ncbi:MAG: LPS export ABC transporter permease LptG, partial [Candidatus Dadabacteria bacterium]
MKVIHRYILTLTLKNLLLALLLFLILFLIFDFFDRIDDLVSGGASLGLMASYFIYKVPYMLTNMLPVAMLVATMFTVGILAKNSEITAMRASGLTIFWIARPIFLVAILLSFFTIIFNETVVPYSTRRVKEIYNIDIKKKVKDGRYSQKDFWWRSGNNFYSIDTFDSRTSLLLGITKLELNESFLASSRTEANEAHFIDPTLGWTMRGVKEYYFTPTQQIEVKTLSSLPLPIKKIPKDFYDVEKDPFTMSFVELKRFIREQLKDGLPVSSYLADLYAKVSFPFVIFIVTLTVLPFCIVPSRTGSMAASIIAGLLIAFTYYAVHSFSLALGRAEIWDPLLAAWMGNLLLGTIGLILLLGTESPS